MILPVWSICNLCNEEHKVLISSHGHVAVSPLHITKPGPLRKYRKKICDDVRSGRERRIHSRKQA